MAIIAMKKIIAAMAVALSLSGMTVFAVNGEDLMVGMPNPMVEYENYREAADVLSFNPLYLPKMAGYRSDDIFVIGGKTGDIRYSGADGSTIIIRSAKARSNEDISGIYGVKWQNRRVSETTVSVAQVSPQSWAARWHVGKYVFSAVGENMKEGEFFRLLSDGLVDMTEHYFQAHGKYHSRAKVTKF